MTKITTIHSCTGTDPRGTLFRCRATDIYISVMTALFPLFTGLDGYLFLNEKKFAFFSVCTSVWLLSLCVSNILTARKCRPAQPDLLSGLILAFAAACTVSTVCSEYASFLSLDTGRCDGLLTYLLYGGILLGVSRYGKARIRYLYLAAGAYLIYGIISATQLMGYNALWLYPGDLNYYDPYVREIGLFLGTLGNIDVGSAFHCLLIPLLFAAVLFGRKGIRFILLLPAVLGLICAVMAGVASGILALGCTAAVGVCVFAAWLYGQKRKTAPPVYLTALLLFALLAGTLLALLYVSPAGSGTLYEIKMLLHGEINDDFGSGRIRIWKGAWRVFCEHPLIGVGPDCLAPYLNMPFERYSEVFGELIVNYADNAHNEYLNLLCSFGILGFLPLAAAQIYTWVKALACWNMSKSVKLILPAMFCYLAQAFFNIGSCIVAPLFYILWGLLLSQIRQNHQLSYT